MTNLDKAAELILPYIGGCAECDRVGDACLDCIREAKDAVKGIAEAGLLAPEQRPPHPCQPMDVHQPAWEFRDGEGYPIRSWVSVLAKRIWLTDGKGRGESLTMSQAHYLVVALLSAINCKDEHDD